MNTLDDLVEFIDDEGIEWFQPYVAPVAPWYEPAGIQDLRIKLRKVIPALIASEIVGVQPMTGPVGKIFSIKYSYDSNE